eukprot:COSAG05_NODE_3546_length_1998_cov_27.151132_4_plen_59_part_00
MIRSMHVSEITVETMCGDGQVRAELEKLSEGGDPLAQAMDTVLSGCVRLLICNIPTST